MKTDVRQRFEEFAGRFAERARPRGHTRAHGAPTPALAEDYWQAIHDLFTRDVTTKGVRDLVQQETPETFRYFTREIDFESLRSKPCWKRYPLAAWKIFLALAYRLSPPRRIFFSVAVPLLGLGWVRYLLHGTLGSWVASPASTLVLLSATFLFSLLVLELRDKLALKGDLEIARQIQFGLLPFEPHEQEGLSVRVAMRPANTVGGDYFDLIDLGGGRLGVVVGDVAGKGMPAALLMALLQGSLRTLVTAGFRGAELIAKLNAHLYANIPSNRLVTLFYAEVDPAGSTLSYINAGHNAPFVLRAGGAIERLPASAMALGVVADGAFEEKAQSLRPGDRLFLYTDGVTEAFNPRDEEYGEARLEAFLAAHRGAAPQALIDALVAGVLAFCGSSAPRDDMTLMVVERAALRMTGPTSASAAGRSS